MKKLCLIAILLFLVTMFVGCGDEVQNTSSNDNITESDNISSVLQSSEEETSSSTSGVTSNDVLDKVNEGARFYEFSTVSNYKETIENNVKTFSFSYALSQLPNDSFGVIGMEDEKGISALHTTFIFNNTDFDGAAALALSYIPTISLYCPELEVEDAIGNINKAFQNGTKNGNKRVFESQEYEYTLNIGEEFLLVSVIRKDTKAN